MKHRIVTFLISIALFGGLLAMLHFLAPILASIYPTANAIFARNLTLAVSTVAWVVGAFLVVQLVDVMVWGLLVRMKSPVPGVLKAIVALVIYLLTIICIVGLVFERSVTGFLAALGAGSFALGLALRNLVSDIFTGLAVNLDRTFTTGDWIEVSERTGATVGQIAEIGWRSTHLRTEDHKTIVIPNSYLGIHRITNVSRPSLATRYQTTITLDFSVPVARAKRVLMAGLLAVHDRPGFYPQNKPEVLTLEAAENGLVYALRYWIISWTGISPNRALDIVMTSVMEHLRTAGLTPAYETTEILHQPMPNRNGEGHHRHDQLALLARLNLFSVLDSAEIEALADSIKRRDFGHGEVLFRQGDAGDCLFILSEGLFEVLVQTGENGSQQHVGRIAPGEFVGEMSVLTGEPRTATVIAATPSVAYEIPGVVLRELLASRTQIAEHLSQVIAERKLCNAETQRRLSETGRAQEVASFASQILARMRNFLARRRSN